MHKGTQYENNFIFLFIYGGCGRILNFKTDIENDNFPVLPLRSNFMSEGTYSKAILQEHFFIKITTKNIQQNQQPTKPNPINQRNQNLGA